LAHQVALGKLDVALVTAVPDTPKLNLLMVADAPIYIALSKDSHLRSNKELRLEDLSGHDWILPAPHVNPHLHEMIQGVKSENRVLGTVSQHTTTWKFTKEYLRSTMLTQFI
jgi:hypothetical protein